MGKWTGSSIPASSEGYGAERGTAVESCCSKQGCRVTPPPGTDPYVPLMQNLGSGLKHAMPEHSLSWHTKIPKTDQSYACRSGVTYLTAVTFVVFWHAIPVFKEGDKFSRKTVICILTGKALRSQQTEREETNFVP